MRKAFSKFVVFDSGKTGFALNAPNWEKRQARKSTIKRNIGNTEDLQFQKI